MHSSHQLHQWDRVANHFQRQALRSLKAFGIARLKWPHHNNTRNSLGPLMLQRTVMCFLFEPFMFVRTLGETQVLLEGCGVDNSRKHAPMCWFTTGPHIPFRLGE